MQMQNFKTLYVKYNFYKLKISIKNLNLSIQNFLNEISTKFCVSENWTWTYVYARRKRAPLKAVVTAHAKNEELNLCVKCYITDSNNYSHTAKWEFNNLKELRNSITEDHADIVPEPIHGGNEIFAMRWVHGSSMKARLTWARFIPQVRLSYLVTAAETLRLLHQAREKCPQPLNVQTYIRAAKNSGATDFYWKKNFAQLIKALNKIEGRPVPHSKLHGDFSPENIIISEEKTTVVDLAYEKIGPNYHDVCHCIMYFSIYCNNFFCNVPTLLMRDIEAFDLAYSGVRNLADDEEFILMLWITFLIRWGRHDAKARNIQRALHLRAADWYFARQIKACCLRLEQSLRIGMG